MDSQTEVAIVTGASRDIGRQVALDLALVEELSAYTVPRAGFILENGEVRSSPARSPIGEP